MAPLAICNGAETSCRLREDPDFDRVYLAVGALDPGRGDVVTGLDIGNALLDQGDDGNIGGKLDSQRLAVPRFDHQILAVELIDRAADAGRRAGGKPFHCLVWR